MKIPVVYGQRAIVIDGKEYQVLAFRTVLPKEQFQELADIMKDFGARYIPDTRKWVAAKSVYEEMMDWFAKDEEWPNKFKIDKSEHEALIEATRG